MAASAHLKTQTQTQTRKTKRRKHRETTISTSVAGPPNDPTSHSPSPSPSVSIIVISPSPSPLTIRLSPDGSSPLMESSSGSSSFAPYPASYTKFNTALNADLLNPMSPPPPPPLARSSPTLFEMMAKEQDCRPRSQILATASLRQLILSQDKEALLQERATEILAMIWRQAI